MRPKTLNRQAIDLDAGWFDEVWTAALAFAGEPHLVMLGGRGSRYTLVALSWDEMPWDEFRQQPPTVEPLSTGDDWTTGQLACISYDGSHRVLRLKRNLVIDHKERRADICSEDDWAACRYQLPLPKTQPPRPASETPPVFWQSSWTDADYLAAVGTVLEEIRAGRYYQLNLLRYWFTEHSPSREAWLQQLARTGGPFSAYIDIPGLHLVSFSPERFFRLVPEADGCWIETEPIKGTRPVAADPIENQRHMQDLASSAKDAAELNMIVDLLRNDLLRVCRPSSVKVLDPGSLHSFANVHHRIARIRGRLRSDLTLDALLSALCPGGSITGAPKREVMQAIREREGRARGWFMGNILYRDAWNGRLDSSILIRTAVHQQRWEFAAGSGLVIHSDPLEESAEVRAKARVLHGILK